MAKLLVILALAFVGVTALPSAAQADDGIDWLPLTGSDIKVGCTWDNGCEGGYHTSGAKAIDFIVPTGRAVYASGPGTVTQALGGCSAASPGCNGQRGNFITISHGGGIYSRYLHLSSIIVSSGSVAAGQLIGYTGSSGGLTGQTNIPHLHYDELTNPTNGLGKRDPGIMYACHGNTKVAYPAQAGYGSWNSMPNWTINLRNDGYGCGGTTPRPIGAAVLQRANGIMDVYARGTNGHLQHRWLPLAEP